MATFTEAMHSVLQTLHVLEDKRTQTDIMLGLLQDHKEWVHCDVFKKHGIRDHRSIKYYLTRRWWVIHTMQPKKWIFLNDEGIYILVGKICPRKVEKRGYIQDFTVEEMRSELFRRDMLSTIFVNDNLYDIIKRID